MFMSEMLTTLKSGQHEETEQHFPKQTGLNQSPSSVWFSLVHLLMEHAVLDYKA